MTKLTRPTAVITKDPSLGTLVRIAYVESPQGLIVTRDVPIPVDLSTHIDEHHREATEIINAYELTALFIVRLGDQRGPDALRLRLANNAYYFREVDRALIDSLAFKPESFIT